MAITKGQLVDSLEIRLTKSRPNTEIQFSKHLLAFYIDSARDALISNRLRESTATDIRIDPAYIFREEVTPTVGYKSTTASTIGTVYGQLQLATTHKVLNILSADKVDLGLVGATLFSSNAKTTSANANTDTSLAGLTDRGWVIISATNVIYSNFSGNANVSDPIITTGFGTPIASKIFNDGDIWFAMSTYNSAWYIGNVRFVGNPTSYQPTAVSGTPITCDGMFFAKDNSKFAIFLGDQSAEGGAAATRIFTDFLRASNEYILTANNFKDIADLSSVILYSACAYDRTNLWLGSSNSILYRADEGFEKTDAFEQVVVDSSNLGNVSYIDFCTKRDGLCIIAGVGLYHTNDAGVTWSAVATPADASDFSQTTSEVVMVDATTWYGRFGDTVYKTTNGGTSWTVLTYVEGTPASRPAIAVGRNNVNWIYYNGASSNAYYIVEFKTTGDSIQSIKKVDERFASNTSKLPFAKPSNTNLVMWRRSGASSDTVVVDGFSRYSQSEYVVELLYIREGSTYSLTDTYGIAQEDVQPILDEAFKVAYQAITGAPLDVSADGNPADETQYAN